MSIKVLIGSTEYSESDIRSISLSHKVNPITTELPINQLQLVMEISAATPVGTWLTLTVDNTVWCKYWVLSCNRASANTYKVVAQSAILLLDRITVPAKMYSSMTVEDALAEFMPASIAYSISADVKDLTISGYCPEQSARNRIQQICFAVGAMVKSFFSSNPIDIVSLDADAEYIPMNKVYSSPRIEYEDVVTAIEVTAYSYTLGTPSTTDEYVQIGNDYYIVSKQVVTVNNSDATANDPTNVIKVNACTLINTSNASAIATRIATYYFNRIKWTGKIIHDGQYIAGNKFSVNTYADNEIISGYATNMNFSFGVGQSADVTLEQAEAVEAGNLVITYKYQTTVIDTQQYVLPVGYVYNISNPALWFTDSSTRGVYSPINEYTTGTIDSGANTAEASYFQSIIQNLNNRRAFIYNVDEAEQKSDGKVVFK